MLFRPRGPDQGSHQHPGPVWPGGRRSEARAGGARQGRQLGQLPPQHASHSERGGRQADQALENER